ncbi:MAG: hypothetical protein M3N29_01620 [Chloroflexota bacterium]|nr:hypothetical protein [Chloroflexota bacterium]
MSGLGISRDELLGGMPARRASTVLFAIENLTNQLVARSRRALARYLPAESARDRERQFIDAVSGGREAQKRPRIQDIERYAGEWAHMVPDVADIHAALLGQMASRYPLDRARCRRIRAALAADSPAVAQAYRRQFGREIDSAWQPQIGWRERLRWWRAGVAERLETMPPFWMAFSLTLTETVGGGMLALPIALAGVGVPAGVMLLGVFGLISIVTIATLVEAIVRDGTMRYGNGYFGQLVENRLGRPGGLAIGVAMYALNAVSLLVAMTGFGTVLAEQTGVSALIWVGLLFVAILFVLRRESLDATIAAALLIGICILVLAGGMIVLGLLNVRPELVAGAGAGVPAAGGEAGGGSIIALVFGVLLFVFFGHTSAGNAARQVLRRDPSGRTLLWGNVAAMVVAAVIYWLFIVAVNGSVPAERLAAETGTAVTPLAEVAGPAVGVLGSIYVLLSLGIGAVFVSLGLYLQTIEQTARRVALTGPLRFAVAAAPVVAIFVLMEAMLWLGVGSFTGPLNLVGALTLPLMGGVFPMLLLAAARRRGERVPGTALGVLGSRPVVVAVIALYLAAVAAHALFIWSDPLERLVAGLTAVAMVALIVVSIRRNSFHPRTVIEVRLDEPPNEGMTVAVIAAGRPVAADVLARLRRGGEPVRVVGGRFDHAADVESIAIDLPAGTPADLALWAHRPTRDGDTNAVPVRMEVAVADNRRRVSVTPERSWLAPG